MVLAAIALALALHARPAAASSDRLFRAWYPQYRDIFNQIIETACAPQYAAYQDGNASFTIDEPGAPSDGANTPGESVVQCILNTTSEFIKANMAAAAVLLGVMPVALSVLGSNSEESALIVIIARRPLLATLLLAGSPVVVALQPFEYKDPVEILRSRERRFSSLNLGPRWLVLALEYIIVLVALANVVHATYQLSVGTVAMLLPDSFWLPGLWAASGVVVHLIGAMCLGSRLRVVDDHSAAMTKKQNWLVRLIRSEFTLSKHKRVTVETLPERKLFLALSWTVSTCTTFHVIFGTLAFSSIQFISVRDAFGVVGRYTASVTAGRIVAMYELSGLRDSTADTRDTTNVRTADWNNGVKALSPPPVSREPLSAGVNDSEKAHPRVHTV